IATGAFENDRLDFFIYDQGPDAMADFSSRGPCEDGRIKPDICAPGTWIASLQSASATDEYAWAPISPNYQYQGGTSQAGPHASGAAAVFVQYYRQTHTNATPSPALVKAALINSANDVLETGPSPNMDAGWGGIDLTQILDSARTFEFLDQAVLLTNTQVFEHRIIIGGTSEPLKITLAYTDVPGFPGAIPALVNDLDLEVVAPDGRLYRGNQFDQGESIPQATSPDTINNVEGIYIDRPVPGEYLVRVRARNVVQDARQDTAEVDQDFALVISGEVPVPGVGVVVLDRGAYTAPGRIQITLLDTDLAGQPSVTVRARSTTEPAGEAVLLTALGNRGSFTGSIATATGPALADGRLQVAQNNTLEIVYFDASAGAERFGTALVDLQPPTLANVSATANFGQALIAWSSDEPSTSLVYYGTNPALASLTLAATNVELTTAHSLTLDDLVIGRTYYFYVVSTDEAGNTATNTNGGALYSVVLPQTAPVLLVDQYVGDMLGTPSLNGYTAALDQLGVRYDVWDGAQQGAPSLATLRPYRAVIWRVSEFGNPPNPAERLTISNYLHNGGAVLIASMELLSRLEEAGAAAFNRDVLQVQSFVADAGVVQITGSTYEAVGNGIDLTMDYAVYEELWSDYMGFLEPDISDTITPTTNATPILRTDTGEIAGLRWPAIGQQAPGRLVYLSFPLDAVPMNGGVNDRGNLLRNILSFLAPGSLGVGTVALDLPAYTLPSVVTVEVGDSRLAGQGTLTLKASSTTQSSGLSVTLQETLKRGVFLGTFFVVDATNAPSPGKLRAQSGDLLRVEYLDINAGATIAATAVIDTDPPSISNILAEPDYEQATLS
ncbi:MAG TPA: S8 family serine peptidase, partial [Bacillota bacterium]|nr:S8 family serine peptidase [Bacillota bacterium]